MFRHFLRGINRQRRRQSQFYLYLRQCLALEFNNPGNGATEARGSSTPALPGART